MFNKVILTGRLTTDVEVKYTKNNVAVAAFSIAVERKMKQGSDKVTDFINLVAWRNTAEFIGKYFTKGSLIGIEGHIETRKYDDRDGNKRTVFEVIVEDAQFVSPKAAASESFEEVEDDGDIPF